MAMKPEDILKMMMAGKQGNPDSQINLDLGLTLTPEVKKRLILAVLNELMKILEEDK